MNELAQRVEQARQRWNAGDLPGYLSLYDEQIKLHGYTPEPMNKTAVHRLLPDDLVGDGGGWKAKSVARFSRRAGRG